MIREWWLWHVTIPVGAILLAYRAIREEIK
jgi:hypothetical protein